MNHPTFAEVRRVNQRLGLSLLSIDGVQAAGFGFMEPSDPELGPAIVVFSEDEPEESVDAVYRDVARALGDVPFRVVAAGAMAVPASREPGDTYATEAETGYSSRVRPVRPGYSIGIDGVATHNNTRYTTQGTAGLIVMDDLGSKYILSNAHILAPANFDAAQLGIVRQPGRSLGDDTIIGSTEMSILIEAFPKLQDFDAAICAVQDQAMLDVRYGAQEPRGILVRGVHAYASLNWQMKKSSLSTGDTGYLKDELPAYVAAIETFQKVDYRILDSGDVNWPGNPGVVVFFNGVVVASRARISAAGDSGSVWLKREDDKATLLTIAGSEGGGMSFCTLVEPVLRRFDVSVPVTPLRPIDGESRLFRDPRISTRFVTDEEVSRISVVRFRSE
jgi:hypothetical protein